MSVGTILLVVLILMLVGALPHWPYSSGWGYYPAGGLETVVVVLIVLLNLIVSIYLFVIGILGLVGGRRV